eukprot:TRINITY_DN10271_c0_g1_i4.p1 TRINITY_DN10271_c0_g1~~TRINITY_DN10271_c0_g1_i4.p1  ORF type:complete len:346 (+),score=80.82 TRINITY_DN10271_c0_g1_i4:57-1094(+)
MSGHNIQAIKPYLDPLLSKMKQIMISNLKLDPGKSESHRTLIRSLLELLLKAAAASWQRLGGSTEQQLIKQWQQTVIAVAKILLAIVAGKVTDGVQKLHSKGFLTRALTPSSAQSLFKLRLEGQHELDRLSGKEPPKATSQPPPKKAKSATSKPKTKRAGHSSKRATKSSKGSMLEDDETDVVGMAHISEEQEDALLMASFASHMDVLRQQEEYVLGKISLDKLLAEITQSVLGRARPADGEVFRMLSHATEQYVKGLLDDCCRTCYYDYQYTQDDEGVTISSRPKQHLNAAYAAAYGVAPRMEDTPASDDKKQHRKIISCNDVQAAAKATQQFSERRLRSLSGL